MNKTYTYPRPGIFSLVFVLSVGVCFGLITKSILVDAFTEKDRIDTIMSCIMAIPFGCISLSAFIGPLLQLLHIRTSKITTTDDGIVIKGLFSEINLYWHEITTFIRKKVSYGFSGKWKFYLKANTHGDKTISVCDEFLSDMNGLIFEFFTKAENANFILKKQNSWVPFTKGTVEVPWEPDDTIFTLHKVS